MTSPTLRPAIDWDRFAVLACALVGVIVGFAQVTGMVHEPFDAIMYWQGYLGDPYWLGAGSYVYPPPMAQLLEPFRWIGWTPFIIMWSSLIWASLGYVAGRWTPLVLLIGVIHDPATVAGLEAVFIGNVTLPMAAAIVLGMTYPAAWAVPLLTKITPGVGVVWFAARREWRQFSVAIGTTALVVVGSFLLLPSSWRQFLDLVSQNTSVTTNGDMTIVGPPLALRLVAAIALIAWGARTNRPWVVPIACGMSVTGLYHLGSVWVVALGAIRLGWIQPRQAAQREREAPGMTLD